MQTVQTLRMASRLQAVISTDHHTPRDHHHLCVSVSQICTSRNPVAAAVLAHPPLAVECVLAEVVPALAVWADAAISFAEVSRVRRMISAQGQTGIGELSIIRRGWFDTRG